jgi:hypothetical protein
VSDRSAIPPKTYGEIGQHLNISAFKTLVHDLNIMRKFEVTDEDLADANVSNLAEYWEARLDRFATLVNQELDEYLTKRSNHITENPNKGRRRVINYADRIEEAAGKLRTLILEAPSAISDCDEFQRLESILEQVPHVVHGLREADRQTGSSLGVLDASLGKERELRNILIHRLYALFTEYTTEKVWYTSNPYEEERYSTPFFRILRLCYSAVMPDLADSTIESHITKAIAAANLRNATSASDPLG